MIDEDLVRRLIASTGDDPNRDGLQETPRRFLDAWKFWTAGYHMDPAKVVKTFNHTPVDELVFQGNIPIFSLCEHHLAPFFGVVHIAYIPTDKIIGLSKLSRLVEVFARRLQVQERLTNQIADTLNQLLTPTGCGVVMQCRHLCMESRGIQKHGTVTVVSAVRGALKYKPEARAEFMSLVNTTIQNATVI